MLNIILKLALNKRNIQTKNQTLDSTTATWHRSAAIPLRDISITLLLSQLLLSQPVLSQPVLSQPRAALETGCNASAQSLFLACGFDTREAYLNTLARCSNTNDVDAAQECVAEAGDEIIEANESCTEIFEARREVCDKVDDQIHDVAFGEGFTNSFVNPLDIGASVIPNPWLPLSQGNRWVYEASGLDDEGEEVEETVVVTVTNRVKIIEGIRCLVVNDVVTSDGEVVEDTDDWFAQDNQGNVWYCGEIARNMETFEGDDPQIPELIDLEGSWKSGRDKAKAGMLLPFAPVVGQTIRQESLLGDAEDIIDVESIEGTETAAAASCTGNCLVTLDYTPLEPGNFENKYYAPGIGLIVETKIESSERLELVEYTVN